MCGAKVLAQGPWEGGKDRATGAGDESSAESIALTCTVLSSSAKGRGCEYFMPRRVDDLPALPVPTSTIFAVRCDRQDSSARL